MRKFLLPSSSDLPCGWGNHEVRFVNEKICPVLRYHTLEFHIDVKNYGKLIIYSIPHDSDMKGTDHFKRTIYMYLEQRAEEDASLQRSRLAESLHTGMTKREVVDLLGNPEFKRSYNYLA